MLLRRDEQFDQDIFPSMDSREDTIDVPVRRDDPLDDVFGSGPPSPSSRDHVPAETGGNNGPHPSDIHRLQAEHSTAGYRDGITAAKAQSIQAGFDEGFSLGATIGLKAGQLLGILEGIAGALKAGGDDAAPKADKLLLAARNDLNTKSIYSEEYWAADGNWKYDVRSDTDNEEGEILFSHVADAHPLIQKWSATVEAEVQKWGITENVLEGVEEAHTQAGAKPLAAADAQPKSAGREALNW